MRTNRARQREQAAEARCAEMDAEEALCKAKQLHRAIESAAYAGDAFALQVLGENPSCTMENIASYAGGERGRFFQAPTF
jgi:hypothetical protein